MESIYTPQIFINGEPERVGSDKIAVVTDISDRLQQTSPVRLNISGEGRDGELRVGQNALLQKNEELLFALVQKNSYTQVKAGENRVRNLSHVQIVRELIHVDTKNSRQVTIPVPADFNSQSRELTGMIQDKQNGRITDAAGFNLSR